MKPLRMLSHGNGRQTVALLRMMAHGEIEPCDVAVCADTQDEGEHFYPLLKQLQEEIPIKIVVATRGKLSVECTKVRTSKSSGNKYLKHLPPLWMLRGDGSMGLGPRHCTLDFKIEVVQRIARQMRAPGQQVEMLMGISLDEVHRMKPSALNWITNRYPLIEKGLTVHDCLNWMTKHGYEIPQWSACVHCAYQDDRKWKHMKEHRPNDFARAVAFDRRIREVAAETIIQGTPYIHRSCIPLEDVDFDASSGQIDMFGDECYGMCGV